MGPGLLESAENEIYTELEKSLPITYKKIKLDHGYRMDLLLEDKLVIEVKTGEALTDVHTAQLLTYLKLGKYK